ncbi:MAG TPA: hypothetical protein VGQ39_11980 [Pyrinomonadaceae bacterium]|nr:hypothetical protein [Pyrinomonadaceae bacterium]
MTKHNFSRRQFLKAGGIGVLGAFAFRGSALAHEGRELTLYIGTFTSGKSEGIYVYRMNRISGELNK